jgi:hypothetical protein
MRAKEQASGELVASEGNGSEPPLALCAANGAQEAFLSLSLAPLRPRRNTRNHPVKILGPSSVEVNRRHVH